jgi:hypothetical protein
MTGHGRFTLFSVAFCIVYTLAFFIGDRTIPWPHPFHFSAAAFKYFPLVHEFHYVDQPKRSGPPISWYGWIVSALIVSLPLALIVPRRLADRLSPNWAGLIPAALIFLVLVYEKRWFF